MMLLSLAQVVKNHFASEFIYNKYKSEKTCGVIERDASGGMSKIAEPVGVIAGKFSIAVIHTYMQMQP